MTYTVRHHPLYRCCLGWINSWRAGGSWGDGFAFLSLVIKPSVRHSFKQVHVLCCTGATDSFTHFGTSLPAISCFPTRLWEVSTGNTALLLPPQCHPTAACLGQTLTEPIALPGEQPPCCLQRALRCWREGFPQSTVFTSSTAPHLM